MSKEQPTTTSTPTQPAAATPPSAVKYDVLVSFTDPTDNAAPPGANVYWAGKSQYPRDGYKPTEDRIAYLQGNTNAFKRPVIAGAPKQ